MYSGMGLLNLGAVTGDPIAAIWQAITPDEINARVGGDGWWYDLSDGHKLSHDEAAQRQQQKIASQIGARVVGANVAWVDVVTGKALSHDDAWTRWQYVQQGLPYGGPQPVALSPTTPPATGPFAVPAGYPEPPYTPPPTIPAPEAPRPTPQPAVPPYISPAAPTGPGAPSSGTIFGLSTNTALLVGAGGALLLLITRRRT